MLVKVLQREGLSAKRALFIFWQSIIDVLLSLSHATTLTREGGSGQETLVPCSRLSFRSEALTLFLELFEDLFLPLGLHLLFEVCLLPRGCSP